MRENQTKTDELVTMSRDGTKMLEISVYVKNSAMSLLPVSTKYHKYALCVRIHCEYMLKT